MDNTASIPDLKQAGLLGGGEQTEDVTVDQNRLLQNFDEFMGTIMMKLDQLEVRVVDLERYCSYLLAKDPGVAERIKQIAEAAEQNSKSGAADAQRKTE